MNKKTFNLYKGEIRRLLRQIDHSFEPDLVYDPNSLVGCDASALRFVIDCLYRDLINYE